MSSVKRLTVSLDSELVDEINFLHRRLGVSRSAMLNEFLREGLMAISAVYRELPESPTERDLVRLRGRSLEVVRSRILEAESVLGGGDDAR